MNRRQLTFIITNLFMRNYLLLLLSCAMAASTATAQEVVKVGKGSYASYTPLEMCRTEYHKPGDWGYQGDQSKYMQIRKLYLREEADRPIPTNDWWTNLITQPYSGRMWSYPQFVQAQSYGVDVQAPSYWIDNSTEMKSNTVVSVKGGMEFNPEAAVAENWHDWDVEFLMQDGDKEMYTTMAHGVPFTWIETKNINPQLSLSRSYQACAGFTDTNVEGIDASGAALSGTVKGVNMFALRMGGDVYGIYLPDNSELDIADGTVTVTFTGSREFVVVGVLHDISDLNTMAKYAYSVPRETKVTWQYAASEGLMKTTWIVTAEDLRTGGAASDVLQGFIPHQYRGTGTPCALPFNGIEYATPHGKLKMAEGASLQIDYKFYGMLPYYAVPNDVDRTQNPYDVAKMQEMLKSYADKGTFGADTYWGGKGLTQMALNMMFAREMGQKELFNQCRDKLKNALVNWLTYTPGETNSFFARYDRWGAMVGYSTSYDSETFNDHHFHYGYFTYAAALLALVDDDFRNNYGEMITLVAKDYANWDRKDTRFPMFRTFDPWAGHSFAGGMGDDNGNGQESSSEAMQGWGGLYLLGVALGNNEMRDAGIFGWLSEARGTAEYWFDRHDDPNTGKEGYHTTDNDEYNIKYSNYLYNEDENYPQTNGRHLPYNSNLTCHGVGFWTYFGYDAIFMQGIQWMPISPALDYLSEDKAFAAWDFNRMWQDKRIGGWLAADKTKDGYLGDSGGWGNVALSYLQRSNPDEAAKIFDMCWDAGEPEFKTYDTNGISYFVTHSHLTYGDIDWTIHASIPTARVYIKGGEKTYMAFNPTDKPITVTFSDGGRLENVAPRRLAVCGKVSKDNTDITPDADVPTDPREELEMVNLALHKPVTASSHENVGTVEENLTDGDPGTRWGSSHEDDQYVTVDLGEMASIYKLRLLWEVSYASEYKVQISSDGKTFTDAKTVSSSGGTDVIMMDDVRTRYIRILGVKRSNQYGISLWELEAYGKLESMTDDDLLGVKMTSEKDVLTQREASKINIMGYTCGGDWKKVTAKWSSADGKITSDGMFTPDVYPRATVTAEVQNLKVSKTFPVEEAIFMGYIEFDNASLEIPVGEAAQLNFTAMSQFKETMDVASDGVIWKVCNENNIEVGGASVNAETRELTVTEPGTYHVIVSNADQTKNYIHKEVEKTNAQGEKYREWVAIETVASDTLTVIAKQFAEINLALHKPVTATSQEDNGTRAELATDGDAGTRWGSAWNGLSTEAKNNQDLTVDLLDTYNINKVIMLWQAARASEYELQVSLDGKEWKTVANPKNSPEKETVTFPETPARYVRMHGITRNMDYGYSIFEFQVFGTGRYNTPTGIDGIGTDSGETVGNIYNINGTLVGNSAKYGSGLRKGVYIQSGKKVVVK